MTPIEQSLVILTAVRNEIEKAVLVFYNVGGQNLAGRMDRFDDDALTFTIQNHLQILISSFLEEWGRFSSLGGADLDVRETSRQVKPAMDRFKGWKGLRSVRSQLLAHPFRDKSGNILFPWDVFRDNQAPTTLAETLLLGMCALMVVDRVKARHAAEQATAESQILQEDRSILEAGIRTSTELEQEFAKIQAELKQSRR